MFRFGAFVLCLLISVHCLAENGRREPETNTSSLNNPTLQENGRLPDLSKTNRRNNEETGSEWHHNGNKQMQETSTSQMHEVSRPQSTDRPLQVNNSKNQVIHNKQENSMETLHNMNENQTEKSKNNGAHNNENEKEVSVKNRQDEGEDEDEDEEVCFNYLGCFNMGPPWKSLLRPISAPVSPEKIQTTLFFFSRQNPVNHINITLYPRINMREAQNLFDPNKISVIIVHGFASSGNSSWLKDMKDAYLKHVDANVMLVDWEKGASSANYLQVAGNTRVVGKQLAIFFNYLLQNFNANPGKFHLIGHSLGAHICSYLGKEVRGIARLTALDPAQPGFEGFSKEVRLDKSDARFVDVVHTDARPFLPTLGFGMITPHGHVDFYMNGGFDQPGCIYPPVNDLPTIKSIGDLAMIPVEVIGKMVACPHGRAHAYMVEAFNETEKCIFWGHKTLVTNVIKTVTNTVSQGLLKKFIALSPVCSKNDCVPLGFATKKSSERGAFVVTTSEKSPYCISEPGVSPETNARSPNQSSPIGKFLTKSKLLGAAKQIFPFF